MCPVAEQAGCTPAGSTHTETRSSGRVAEHAVGLLSFGVSHGRHPTFNKRLVCGRVVLCENSIACHDYVTLTG